MSTTAIEVAVEPAYSVHVGPDCLDEISTLAAGYPRCFVVSESHAFELHGERLALPDAPRYLMPSGEAAKQLSEVEALLEALATAGLDRQSLLVTLGGGALCDAAGLAASLYMRGIAVAHAPTTLLAQVDASVGGKTAVNLSASKNLAGTFHQPVAVFADTRTLSTLAPADFRSGLGEIVKTAMLEGPYLWAELERETDALLARQPETLATVVAGCVRAKAVVVAADPHERGPRRGLNLGHTFAHAIEHTAGFGTVPHGIAVAAGLGVALACSAALGLLHDPDLPARWQKLSSRLGLPGDLADLRRETGLALSAADLLAALRLDKKSREGAPRLVLPRALGEVELDVEADPGLLATVLG